MNVCFPKGVGFALNSQNVNNVKTLLKTQMSTKSNVREELCLSTAFAVIMNLCKEVMKVTTLALPSSERGYNTILNMLDNFSLGVLLCCILQYASLCSLGWSEKHKS